MEGSPAVVLILLLAWGVWYTRPVSVYGLIPGVKRADSISLYSRPLGPYRSDGPSSIRDLRPEDPKWDAALRALEAPAFAVPPWNLLLSLFQPKPHPLGNPPRETGNALAKALFPPAGAVLTRFHCFT